MPSNFSTVLIIPAGARFKVSLERVNSVPPSLIPAIADAARRFSGACDLPSAQEKASVSSVSPAWGSFTATSAQVRSTPCANAFTGEHGVPPTHANVLGVLSLILWSLLLIISVKYLILILRADNRGEGGILALATLVSDVVRRGKFLFLLGLFGAALLYADGMITPAISVLSAVEGLHVATPLFDPYVVPIAVAILIGLFFFQSRGTTGVGKVSARSRSSGFSRSALSDFTRSFARPRCSPRSIHGMAFEFFMNNGRPRFCRARRRLSRRHRAAKRFMRTSDILAPRPFV